MHQRTNFHWLENVFHSRPDTGIEAPYTPPASSDARASTTSAMAAGVTQRLGSACGMVARFSDVSMMQGSTQLTFAPGSLNLADMASVRRIGALVEAL